jgi:pyruvate dehydrogenase E2 component (dihydrolipoamide acetyltransferase)
MPSSRKTFEFLAKNAKNVETAEERSWAMPFDFVLPDLGEGITEGEVRKWLVKEGDEVEEHQTVLEIETDKAIVEVPSPRKGRVSRINKHEDDVVKVGEVLMTISEEGEAAEKEPGKPKKERESVSVVGVLPEEEEEEVLATPGVRALAKELGVNIETVKGSGPAGSITKDDVRGAAEKTGGLEKEEKPEKPQRPSDRHGETERIVLKGLRKTIARNLIQSQKMTAFVTGMEEADITELWDLREREKKSLKEKGIHLTFLPFFIKAVQHALSEHPYLNASLDEENEEIILKKYFNIGIAVDTPDGLMVPVIKEAEKKTILELASDLQELSVRARERKIGIEEMKGGTFTITNYGHFGGTFATPIINYPETAILGTGKISEKPWVRDGQIVIRKILPLSLTFDHRVTDGVDSSRFLTKIVNYLEDPALLFIESA